MNTLDAYINAIAYYHDQYKQQARIATPQAVLNSSHDLAFVSNQERSTRVDQLEFITEKFKEFAKKFTSKNGIENIVRKLPQSEYEALADKLRFIQKRSLLIARSEIGWGMTLLGFAADVFCPARNPISNAEIELHKALKKIDKTYETESTQAMPLKLENLRRKLHLAAFQCTLRIQNTIEEYAKGNHTLQEFVGTVEELIPFLSSLKSSLDETNAEMLMSVRDVTSTSAAIRIKIRDELAQFEQTVLSIKAAASYSYQDLEEEIKEYFFAERIETASKEPFDPAHLASLIHTTFIRLNTVKSKTTPLVTLSCPTNSTKFMLNVFQLEQLVTNLRMMKPHIELIENVDRKFQIRELFDTKPTMTEADWFLEVLRENSRWSAFMKESRTDSPISFYRDYWLFKNVSLFSFSEVKKFTETLEIYRSKLHEVWVSSRDLSSKFTKPEKKFSIPSSAQNLPKPNVKQPSVIRRTPK